MSGADEVRESPLVSVVINCYNGERYLKEAIDSVYTQTWPRWEIVFWDNASTDGSARIAQSYDQRLRYFRAQRNTILGEARNLAFKEARGKFITMLDCDDVWLPDTIERLVAAIDDGDEYAVCYAGFERINGAGERIGSMIPRERRGNLFGDFLRQFDVFPCSSMVRRSVLTETGTAFDVSLTTSEDYCFFMTLAVDHPFHSLAESVARYRVHEGALTNRTIAKWADEWEYTLLKIQAAHPGIEKRFADEFRHAFARVDYYRARNLMQSGDRAGARKLLKRNIGVDLRYLALFFLSMLPVNAWHRVHAWYHKRSTFS